MRTRHIEAFHAIYTNGSISSAAEALSVSQPTFSKLLKSAEERLGFALFRRVRGRLVPTDDAHVLFHEASDIQQRLSSLRRTARNLRGGGGGHLRLAVLPALGLTIAPAAIARFRSQHPQVTFAKPDMFLGEKGDQLPRAQAITSGRATGVPGVVRMLEKAHRKFGARPWAEAFHPAIRLANTGFIVSPRMAHYLNSPYPQTQTPDVRQFFVGLDGSPLRAGDHFVNTADFRCEGVARALEKSQ